MLWRAKNRKNKVEERHDGKIQIESKKDMKKRGVESPNRADALCLTEYFASEDMRRMNVVKKKKRAAMLSSWRTV